MWKDHLVSLLLRKSWPCCDWGLPVTEIVQEFASQKLEEITKLWFVYHEIFLLGQNLKKIIIIIYDNIFILLNEHCLNPEVFINIEEIVQYKYIGQTIQSMCTHHTHSVRVIFRVSLLIPQTWDHQPACMEQGQVSVYVWPHVVTAHSNNQKTCPPVGRI